MICYSSWSVGWPGLWPWLWSLMAPLSSIQLRTDWKGTSRWPFILQGLSTWDVYLVSNLACFFNTAAGSQMEVFQEDKPSGTTAYQASACIRLANVPLAKGSHMAKLCISKGGDHIRGRILGGMVPGGHQSHSLFQSLPGLGQVIWHSEPHFPPQIDTVPPVGCSVLRIK